MPCGVKYIYSNQLSRQNFPNYGEIFSTGELGKGDFVVLAKKNRGRKRQTSEESLDQIPISGVHGLTKGQVKMYWVHGPGPSTFSPQYFENQNYSLHCLVFKKNVHEAKKGLIRTPTKLNSFVSQKSHKLKN